MSQLIVTEVRTYQMKSGKQPFTIWLNSLDTAFRAAIRARIERLKFGHLGDCKHVGDGVLELRVFKGPGFRLYVASVGDQVVILLCGGDKGSQSKDINQAKKYLADYKERT